MVIKRIFQKVKCHLTYREIPNTVVVLIPRCFGSGGGSYNICGFNFYNFNFGVSVVFHCFYLLIHTEHSIRNRRSNRKKRAVTTTLRWVSSPFQQEQHLDGQEHKQQSRRIGLRTENKQQHPAAGQRQRNTGAHYGGAVLTQ